MEAPCKDPMGDAVKVAIKSGSAVKLGGAESKPTAIAVEAARPAPVIEIGEAPAGEPPKSK